ncbi:MAG: hypothetical protein JWR90_1130, partial [Marmoricola sp.]|nr:hypothetical protein [Marmoricola sp.]
MAKKPSRGWLTLRLTPEEIDDLEAVAWSRPAAEVVAQTVRGSSRAFFWRRLLTLTLAMLALTSLVAGASLPVMTGGSVILLVAGAGLAVGGVLVERSMRTELLMKDAIDVVERAGRVLANAADSSERGRLALYINIVGLDVLRFRSRNLLFPRKYRRAIRERAELCADAL